MKVAIYCLRFTFAVSVVSAIANVVAYISISQGVFSSNYWGYPDDVALIPRFFLGSFVYLTGILVPYVAIVDLRTIPETEIEPFGLRSLGGLGLCGLALFLLVLMGVLESIVQIHGFVVGGSTAFHMTFIILSSTLAYILPYLLIGSMCFYLRYRIAANRRLASAHKP